MNTTHKLPELDKWDHAVIYYVKQDKNPTIEGVKQIWAERCGIDVCCIYAEDMIAEFLPIVQGLFTVTGGNMRYDQFEFIKDCAPRNAWKFGFNKTNNDDPHDTNSRYFERVLSVILSRLRHTESKYLPGFEEYFHNHKPLKSTDRNAILAREANYDGPASLMAD